MLVPGTDSKGLSHSELFLLSRGLAMLGSRFRPQRISHKHTLHLCFATLTVCRPDLKAPDLHWTIRIFENPDSCCLHFLECFMMWFADCSHCNQATPFPTKKTRLVSMIRSHLQQTFRLDQSCYWCCRLWCRLLCRRHSTASSCSSWQLQINWISTRVLSFHPRHSVDCNCCSATTFIFYVQYQMC